MEATVQHYKMKNKIKIGMVVLLLALLPSAIADMKEDGYFDYVEVGYLDAEMIITEDLGVTDDALFNNGATINGNLHLNGLLYVNGVPVNLKKCIGNNLIRNE